MKFTKQKIQQMKQHYHQLNQQQQAIVTDLVWNGNKGTNKIFKLIGKEAPGITYKKIYDNLKQVILFYEFKQTDYKTLIELEKQLLEAYKNDPLTSRLKHLTKEMQEYYPEYETRIKKIMNNLKEEIFLLQDLNWIENELIPDLKECETLDKKRLTRIS